MQERIERGTLYLSVMEYTPEYGEYQLSEGWAEALAGKTLEKQIEHFRVLEDTSISHYSYGKDEGSSSRTLGKSLWDSSDVHGIIVDKGIIVGLWVYQYYNSNAPLFLGKTICTYSVSEDDGTGSTDREDYISLIFNKEI